MRHLPIALGKQRLSSLDRAQYHQWWTQRQRLKANQKVKQPGFSVGVVAIDPNIMIAGENLKHGRRHTLDNALTSISEIKGETTMQTPSIKAAGNA